MIRREPKTRLHTEKIIDGGTHIFKRNKKQCIIPFDEEKAHNSFDALGRAIQALSSIGTNTETDDYNSSFVYAMRRFKRVFNVAYDDVEKDYRLPIQGEIFTEMQFHTLSDEIGDRTITIEKTNDELILTYQHGFKATDETLMVGFDEESNMKRQSIRGCGKGIKGHHSPYSPSLGEKWRRTTPSKVSFSIGTRDDEFLLGIMNDNPDNPMFWYWWYEAVTQLSGPYANVTFSMPDQTSVVQYTADYEEQTLTDKVQTLFNSDS